MITTRKFRLRSHEGLNRAPSKSEGNASDMALDACVVRHISRDIKHRVRGIDVHGGDAAPFRFSEFATRVAGAMNTERDNDGESAGIFKTVPSRYGDFFFFWNM